MECPPKMKQLRLPFLADQDACHLERLARKRGFKYVAGVDEAGRGPLAGPVVAAAVILPDQISISGIDDSKRLSPARRELLYKMIRSEALAIGIGVASHEEIDSYNVLQATLLAMKRAVARLEPAPDYILVDGLQIIPGLDMAQQAIPKGDQVSISIGAASIVAKVERDIIMDRYHDEFPMYNFRSNKGYSTVEHRRAIGRYGYCRIHRKTFTGVKELVGRKKPYRHGA